MRRFTKRRLGRSITDGSEWSTASVLPKGRANVILYAATASYQHLQFLVVIVLEVLIYGVTEQRTNFLPYCTASFRDD